MSGKKYSEYMIERQRQLQLMLMNNLETTRNQSSNLNQKIRELLLNSSKGIKSTFPDEFNDGKVWLQKSDKMLRKEVDTQTVDLLEQVVQERNKLVSQGRDVLSQIENILTIKSSALAEKYSRILSNISSNFHQEKHLIETWQGNDSVNSWESKLLSYKKKIEAEDFKNIEANLQSCNEELSEKISEAKLLDTQHQKRMYLLKALRQTCIDMGFEEIQKPVFENPDQKSGRIKYVVDTVNRGKIEFFLSLTGIDTNSQMSRHNCFEEFDMLSEYLEENFEITTHFDHPEIERPPRLIRRGEKDEPDGQSVERHA